MGYQMIGCCCYCWNTIFQARVFVVCELPPFWNQMARLRVGIISDSEPIMGQTLALFDREWDRSPCLVALALHHYSLSWRQSEHATWPTRRALALRQVPTDLVVWPSGLALQTSASATFAGTTWVGALYSVLRVRNRATQNLDRTRWCVIWATVRLLGGCSSY